MWSIDAVHLVHYLELLFLTVFALPNASRTGLDCQTSRRIRNIFTVSPTVFAKKHVGQLEIYVNDALLLLNTKKIITCMMI